MKTTVGTVPVVLYMRLYCIRYDKTCNSKDVCVQRGLAGSSETVSRISIFVQYFADQDGQRSRTCMLSLLNSHTIPQAGTEVLL